LSNPASTTERTARIPAGFWLAVFAPFGAAYLISFGLRSVNAAIAPDLTREFALDAADLGLLTAAYFLSFSFTQIPLGAWLDRFRPRRVNAALLLACAAGCFVFAAAPNLQWLVAGRILIGVGVAACLMASLRTFRLWVDAGHLPSVNGAMLAVGNAGAIASTAPVLWLLGLISWGQLFVVVGMAALLTSAWLAFKVPDPPTSQHADHGGKPHPSPASTQTVAAVGWADVLASREFWAIVPIACLTNAVGLAVQGLWAGPWLIDVAGIPRERIGYYLLLVPAGMLAANLALGRALTHWVGRGGSAVRFTGIACIAALVGQAPFLLSWSNAPAVVMLLFGLTHVCGNLAFAALAPHFPAAVAGRLVTTINFILFMSSFLLQWGMGLVINGFPAAAPGAYRAEGYEAAFLTLLAMQVIAFAWTFHALRRRPPRGAPG